ncbi:hypothetical protein ACQ4PT_043928 [Festuca glaucescens]
MGDHQRDLAFPPPGHCLPRTSSMSVTDSVTAVHDFRVTGYSLLDGMGVGRYVSSRVFTVGGLEWAVRFYPDGSTAHCVGNASAFLYYCGRDKDVRARFTLNLMEKDGRLSQVTNAYMKHSFSPASDNWGFIKFIEKSKIQGSPFLHNDCLTIRCLLTVAKESRTQDVETSLITVPKSNLHKDFENMLNDGEGADVTFLVLMAPPAQDIVGEPDGSRDCDPWLQSHQLFDAWVWASMSAPASSALVAATGL